MDLKPKNIRQPVDFDKLTKGNGDFCGGPLVSPWKLSQLTNILFKKPDARALFGPLSHEAKHEDSDS